MKEHEATLNRCSYRSAGPQLTQNVLEVVFEVDGEAYTHLLPNAGWSYQTPALAFMGYIEKSPKDFDGDSIDFEDETVPVVRKGNDYLLSGGILVVGARKLKESDWFDEDGDVWNGTGQGGNAGPGSDPNTGNRAGVPVDGEE